jgi:hypothetical protein
MKKKLIFINFEIFARLFRERFFSNKIQTSHADSNSIQTGFEIVVSQHLDMPFNNNTNYEYDEGAPLTGFLNYIRMNQD